MRIVYHHKKNLKSLILKHTETHFEELERKELEFKDSNEFERRKVEIEFISSEVEKVQKWDQPHRVE